MTQISNLSSKDLFFNRELSWLAFNERVLEEALNTKTPLLERLKFLSIFNSNLDEFFMVRIAGLKKMQKEGFIFCETPDENLISDILSQLKIKIDTLLEKFYKCFFEILNLLKEEGIIISSLNDLNKDEINFLDLFFKEHIFPILTPLAVDSSHPYPFFSNLAIYLAIEFENKNSQTGETYTGFVEVPSVLSRIIEIPNKENKKKFVLLEDVISSHIEELFLGFSLKSFFSVRVTRNLDYNILENSVVDLMDSIQKAVIHRQHQEAVRLEISGFESMTVLDAMIETLKIEKNKDVYKINNPLFISGLMDLYKQDFPHLKEESFNPRLPARFSENQNIFSIIKQSDLLVHHPYESFYAVTEFLGEAANDSQVLAIKQTLYRTSGDSPIIESLIKAAENGKHVTAVVELKARFDEKNNILWARRLERAGVNVVYGFVGLKTHCKATLVVRKEGLDLVKYIHLSTGNYNSQTAKFYSDLGFFTSDQVMGQDIASLFNLLTGFNVIDDSGNLKANALLPRFEKIILSPIYFRSWLINKIDELIIWNKKNPESPASLTAKMNSLVDQKIIHKLYEASQSGVIIKLIIRGVCALKPGIKGLSENIRVKSIIDRFLEHSRIYFFQLGKEDNVYLSSADWVSRSFSRRIEIAFQIYDKNIKNRLINEIIFLSWNDNQKARELHADGNYYIINNKEEKSIRSQEEFIALARQAGIKSIPYEKAIRTYKGKRRSVRSPLGEKKK